MARRFLFSRLKHLLVIQAPIQAPNLIRLDAVKPSAARQTNRGFTLLELVVVVAIAGALVSGLMFIVVQLMQADQRESARNETQREMQLALDYISTELREAVFVYTGDYMPDLADNLPASLTGADTKPVIAFWKYHPFPDAVRTACASATPPAGVGCMSGQSYSLVVYSLTRNPRTGSPWRGGARITRYALTQFQGNSTTVTPGYVNPGDAANFDTWPLDAEQNNLQRVRPTASSGTVNTLVDFVDGQADASWNTAVRCPGSGADNPYTLSPPDSMLNRLPRSFYACVSSSLTTTDSAGTRQNLQATGAYQDVILYLRGSAVGRPGIPNDLTARSAELLPTLETRVMLRGVLTRTPAP